MKTKPCVNEQCGSYDDTKKHNCNHGFSKFETFTCKNYITLDDDDVWDKIVNRMEGGVPKNGG